MPMPYRAEPSRSDRVKAIASVAAIYAAMIAAMLLVRTDTSPRTVGSTPPVLIEIEEPPIPPAEPDPGKAREEEGAAGKKDEQTPIVTPQPKIVVPAKPPVAAAPVAGTGLSPNAGAATAGNGPGAGGSGTGRGGGGSGGAGGGLGSDARLLGGNSAKLPARLLRQFSANRGYGYLLLTISDQGRVSDCSVLQSTGYTPVDEALCALMIGKSRWAAARDRQGDPVSVKVRYTATWSKTDN